jgi:hypothetical protein
MHFRLATALLALATAPAHAESITANFEGALGTVMGVAGATTGTTFSGTYTYDDSVLMESIDADSGKYTFGGSFPATGFSITIHTPTPVEFAGTPLRDIELTDGAAADSMRVTAETGPTGSFLLQLDGGTDLLTSLDLGVPDLPGASGQLQYTNLGAGFILFSGILTSLSTVPEPSSAVLVGLALVGLAQRRFRSRVI